MKIGIFVLILIIVLAAAIIFIQKAGYGEKGLKECSSDADCAPKTCCHPTECAAKADAPVCTDMCTLECAPGTMDCNQGNCLCQNNKCIAQIIP